MADALGLTMGGPFQNWSGVSFFNFSVDSSTDKIEFIFSAAASDTITQLGVRIGSRTGTPPTYRISLQGVSLTTGRADGTIKASGNANATFTPPADTTWNGTFQWFTLTGSYACTRGELLSIVVDYSSGTIDASNFTSFTADGNFNNNYFVFPFFWTVNSGSASSNTREGIYGYKSATRSYHIPINASTVTVFSSTSTPNEYALRFLLPGSGTTYTVAGVEVAIDSPDSGNAELTLYGSDGTTVLQSFTMDKDANLNHPVSAYRAYFANGTLATLTAGVAYRIGFRALANPAGIGLPVVSVPAAGDMTAFPGGEDWFLSTRTYSTGSESWTDTTTSRPLMGLILGDITEPSGGGIGGRVIGGGF